jgi:hypothetical protein
MLLNILQFKRNSPVPSRLVSDEKSRALPESFSHTVGYNSPAVPPVLFDFCSYTTRFTHLRQITNGFLLFIPKEILHIIVSYSHSFCLILQQLHTWDRYGLRSPALYKEEQLKLKVGQLQYFCQASAKLSSKLARTVWTKMLPEKLCGLRPFGIDVQMKWGQSGMLLAQASMIFDLYRENIYIWDYIFVTLMQERKDVGSMPEEWTDDVDSIESRQKWTSFIVQWFYLWRKGEDFSSLRNEMGIESLLLYGIIVWKTYLIPLAPFVIAALFMKIIGSYAYLESLLDADSNSFRSTQSIDYPKHLLIIWPLHQILQSQFILPYLFPNIDQNPDHLFSTPVKVDIHCFERILSYSLNDTSSALARSIKNIGSEKLQHIRDELENTFFRLYNHFLELVGPE